MDYQNHTLMKNIKIFAKFIYKCSINSLRTLSVKQLMNVHNWAQQKLSPLSPLNILLSINGPLISFWFNGLNN